MNEYRAYLMEPDGRIRSLADLVCEHEMAMIERKSDANTELTLGTQRPLSAFRRAHSFCRGAQ